MTHRTLLPVVGMMVAALAACSKISVDFTYSPTEPAAGEAVTFTNLSDGGEEWSWAFSDGTTSSAKSPTKIFQTPGNFTVTLRVDDKSRYTVTKQITVRDTMPQIAASTDTVCYMQKLTFSIDIYNPQSRTMSTRWLFSPNVVGSSVTDGISTLLTPEVFFKTRNATETVCCIVTLAGKDPDTIYTNIYVNDVTARSLLMVGNRSNIMRQRIFDNDVEPATRLTEATFTTPTAIATSNDIAYVFDAGTPDVTDGSITAVNLNDGTQQNVLRNTSTADTDGAWDMYAGLLDGSRLYWSGREDYIFTVDAQTRNATFDYDGTMSGNNVYVRNNRLGYYGHGINAGHTGGLCRLASMWLWTRTDGGKGIYRFIDSDILDADVTSIGTPPTAGCILTDMEIKNVAVDAVNMKLYVVSSDGRLLVCNIDGSGQQVAATGCTGPLAIDNADDMLFWADASGVHVARLAVSTANNVTGNALFASQSGVTAIAVDYVARY